MLFRRRDNSAITRMGTIICMTLITTMETVMVILEAV